MLTNTQNVLTKNAETNVRPAWQLGHRQRETWATLTDDQRRRVNLLALEGTKISAAIRQALAELPADAPATDDLPTHDPARCAVAGCTMAVVR